MLQLEISREAENDLMEIWLYIAEDQPANADNYLDKLHEKAQKLAEFPNLGRERPELGKSLLSFPVDRYSLYYVITDSKLVIVRVLPGDRDIVSFF